MQTIDWIDSYIFLFTLSDNLSIWQYIQVYNIIIVYDQYYHSYIWLSISILLNLNTSGGEQR